ncbi:MAG: GNAT family N-acetyltransferase [Sphingomonadaceae bacterium]
MTAPASPFLRERSVPAPALQPAIDAGLFDEPREAADVCWLPASDWTGLTAEWQALAAGSEPNVFLAPAFALAARQVDAGPGLGAFVFRHGPRLTGFVAGRFGLAGRLFRLWTHPYAPLSLPLVAEGEEHAILEALMGALAGRGCAALEASHLPDGPFAESLAGFAEETGRSVATLATCRRAALAGPPPGPAKEMRRQARRLADLGTVAEISTASGLPPGAAIAAFLALEAAGWKGRRGTAMAGNAEARSFFCEALSGLLAAQDARIDLLTLDGRPIAGAVTLIAGSRAWYWKTAYDESLARFSPGALLSQRLGTSLMADGRTGFVDSCAVPGHSMIDRLWPARLGISHRLVAVQPLTAGLAFHALVALRRGVLVARDRAKRLLKR